MKPSQPDSRDLHNMSYRKHYWSNPKIMRKKKRREYNRVYNSEKAIRFYRENRGYTLQSVAIRKQLKCEGLPLNFRVFDPDKKRIHTVRIVIFDSNGDYSPSRSLRKAK